LFQLEGAEILFQLEEAFTYISFIKRNAS